MQDISLQIDLGTALSFFLTGFVSAWLFFRRYKEESTKSRVAQLEAKSLDFLFRFRDTLVRQLSSIHNLSDQSEDLRATQFTEIRSATRDLVDEMRLFASPKISQEMRAKLVGLNREYRNYFDEINKNNPSSDVVSRAINRWKAGLFELLEHIEMMILDAFEASGIDKKGQRELVRSIFAEMRKPDDTSAE